MLAPETRRVLTDALRPPAGYAVSVAVATTYSLDLTALLLAPMTFALHDESLRDLDAVDPIKVLEAVRRHAEHTTVFTQAGRIHVPSSYRTILTFTEDCVREVSAPVTGRVFHPKIWAVRFDRPGGPPHHRFLCASRNLTFDRSWDTLLVLDESPVDVATPTVDPAPLSRFLRELPGLCLRPVGRHRVEQVESLAESFGRSRLGLPSEFESGRLLPLGFDWSEPFPLLAADRALVVSPFLDVTTVRALGAAAPEVRLVTRAESLERVGSEPLGSVQTFVLQRAAEREVGADLDEPEPAMGLSVPEGLHAKTWVLERDGQAVVVTGSANATGAGVGARGNVEFDVTLTGRPERVGVEATWTGTKESPGLSRLTQPYSPMTVGGEVPEAEETSREIEIFHALLAAAQPRAIVEALPDDRYVLIWEVAGELIAPGPTTIRPITLDESAWARPFASSASWRPVSVRALTPFFAVSTTAGSGPGRATVSSVIVAELVGDPESRRQDALRDVLRTRADVLRYLAFLLGDSSLSAWVQGGGGDWKTADLPGGRREDVILFEPLIRALADGGRGLDRIASAYAELKRLDNASELVPEGWDALWNVVWTAHKTGAPT